MKVNEWFENGCDYDDGIAIYIGLKQAKPNLIRLFKKKKNNTFYEKLKYELSKYKEVEVVQQVFTQAPSQPKQEKVNPQVNKNVIASETKQSVSKPTYKPAHLNDFPLELHPTFIKQKNDYYTACTLKHKLNALHPDDEAAALKLCLEIESLFDAVEQAWKVLDHYTEHKTVLEIKTTDFSKLTPAQLLQRRNLTRANSSKTKARIKALKETLSNATTIPLKTKTQNQLEKAEKKLLQLNTDVEQLNQLINGK